MDTKITVNSKIVRSGVYVEPLLYTIAQRAAENRGESYSMWARRVILERLVQEGLIKDDEILALAAS